ncbi:MAG TPA: hypothetical protein PLL72_10010 [Burkholderiaceae bacterium]|nr:hypothetical protein [Burkholderiaceae bacterium]
MSAEILSIVEHVLDSEVARTGFELGWDHARHGLTPPAEQLSAASAIRQGYEAGRASFGGRTRLATPMVQLWLQLRQQAWLRGLAFETLSVTPNYLGQLQTSHCPVTRCALAVGRQLPPHGAPEDRVVARVCEDAGYAAGNLAVIGLAADLAKADLAWDDAWARAETLRINARRHGIAQADGLNANAWRRLAVLMSFVTPLAHHDAARLPLLVLPPNRLHLLNPIQGLQVLATQLLARSGWSQRLSRFLALLPSDALRGDFQRVFLALLPKVIAAGAPTDALRRRWALEDAWLDAEVLQLWQRFALQLDAERSQALLERATAEGLMGQRVLLHSDEQATDGWALETRGYLPSGCGPMRQPRQAGAADAARAQPRHAALARLAAPVAAQPRQLPLLD